ncbi:hypothetical protein GCM10029976_010860 [Kribbella albertanoniae]|uniref:Aminoglycoside phosphotransferase n=1 Tax=Kribbella albertanoniae TaxID=1266829 RepID=A0A4V2XPZ1_9ACTN|nr:phosphotransferase [Kribbella albertanoniae]TDC23565.1 aminoglycoside phosphotransferase [Kribbella albertanoniae]
MKINDNGWSSRAWLEGDWLHRAPRRDDVRPRLLAEAQLLPWLAPQLPLPVPVPELTADGVRHRVLIGEPLEAGSTALGRELGSFLKALHAVDPADALAHGAGDPEAGAADKRRFLAEARDWILPLLPESGRAAGVELLDRVEGVRSALIHADLGSDHLLVHDGRLTGIIDWTDSEIGDPALDLSWLLNDAPEGIAEGVAQTYEVTPDLRRRALDWHRLAPWFTLHRGLLLDLQDDRDVGLAGVLARL